MNEELSRVDIIRAYIVSKISIAQKKGIKKIFLKAHEFGITKELMEVNDIKEKSFTFCGIKHILND